MPSASNDPIACAASLAAETVKTDTAVFVQTDPKSTVLTRLKAGSTITVVGEAPAGWRRVEVSGPFEAYAQSRDITKGLEVREGGNGKGGRPAHWQASRHWHRTESHEG